MRRFVTGGSQAVIMLAFLARATPEALASPHTPRESWPIYGLE